MQVRIFQDDDTFNSGAIYISSDFRVRRDHDEIIVELRSTLGIAEGESPELSNAVKELIAAEYLRWEQSRHP